MTPGEDAGLVDSTASVQVTGLVSLITRANLTETVPQVDAGVLTLACFVSTTVLGITT